MLLRQRKTYLPVLAALVLTVPTTQASAQTTVWNWLGIPQGVQRVRDGMFNKHGNFPGLERKPKLKRLADPALKDHPDAAIAKAQEIKAEEDLAPQKIKAIKYLAKVGCGKCYKGVDEALLEAMKDCTEKVRLAAVEAIGDTGNPKCPQCDNSCCGEKITEQLAKMAYERDPDHPQCWFEPSERVREAAREAVKNCCQGGPLPIQELPADQVPERVPEQRQPESRDPEGNQPESDSSASLPAGASDNGALISIEGQPVDNRPIWVSDDHAPAIQKIENGVEPQQPLPKVFAQPDKLPAIQQPATLTRRAQQPALRFALPAKTEPRIAKRPVVHQPKKLMQPSALVPVSHLKPVKAEKRVVKRQPSERFRSLIPIRTFIPQPKAKPVRSTPVKNVSVTKKSAPQQKVVSNNGARGTVARVSTGAGTVQLRFRSGNVPSVGSVVKVTHRYLLSRSEIGELQIIAVGSTMATAQPIGGIKLSRIQSGDQVVVQK